MLLISLHVCLFAGATESVGKHMLEACNNNLEMAVTMFLDGGGIAEEPSTSASSAGASSSRHPPVEWVTSYDTPKALGLKLLYFFLSHCMLCALSLNVVFSSLAEMMCEHPFLRSRTFWWSQSPCLEVQFTFIHLICLTQGFLSFFCHPTP